MKKLLITSILTILTLPAFADDASNPFANAKTADEAWGIFETESQNILNKYKSQLKNKEFKKLTELRQDLLENKPATSAEISDEKSKTNEQDKDKNTQAKDTKETKQKGKVKRELTEEELLEFLPDTIVDSHAHCWRAEDDPFDRSKFPKKWVFRGQKRHAGGESTKMGACCKKIL